MAKTYSALGLVHNWRGERPEIAASNCQQAQNILSKLVQQYPKDSEYKSLLAATQMNLGQVYLTRSWHDEAETAPKQAVGIYGELVEGRPDALPEDRESLGKSHVLLGMAYRDANETEKADKEQQQALQIFEKLAQEHPDVLEYAYDVGRCRIELGRAADRGRRPKAALEEYAKAIEIMEQAMHKGYLKARLHLLNTRINRAAVLSEQGDHRRATEEVEALLRQPNLTSLNVYNAACVFSRASAAADHDTKLSPTDHNRVKARYAERAMELLRQAVAKGWRHPRVIKEDPDLEPLRARKDFQKLLADLEKQTKE